MADLRTQLDGYRLTTAEIIYRMPDHPDLLQTFLWQQYDLVPRYPRLQKFLTFWRTNLDGQIHSVRFASETAISASVYRHLGLDSVIH